MRNMQMFGICLETNEINWAIPWGIHQAVTVSRWNRYFTVMTERASKYDTD